MNNGLVESAAIVLGGLMVAFLAVGAVLPAIIVMGAIGALGTFLLGRG